MYHRFIEQISEFIFAEDEPEKADIIFIPGNGYSQMAEKAAALYGKKYAPFVLPSGKYSITVGKFGGVLSGQERYNGKYRTEWENARLSREVTDKAGIEIKKALLCCKNYHARRALMYYQRAYPEVEFRVCPCCVDGVTKENWMNSEEGIQSVLGEVQRIVTQFALMM